VSTFLHVPPTLGLGGLSIGRTWGVDQVVAPSESKATELLGTAVQLGITIWDTAPAYFSSEARMSLALQQMPADDRAQIRVMTKFGEHAKPDGSATYADHSYSALMSSFFRSQRMLGRIDALQVHKATAEVVLHKDVLQAIAAARSEGVACIGASVSDMATGMVALTSGYYDFLQCPFSQANEVFLPLLEYANVHRIPMIINRPFAMGFLVGNGDGNAARQAYAHVLRHMGQGVVLTGTGKPTHLIQNAQAFAEARSDVPCG
jgi:aryl-alcohol dehydrogenase-like predicted oxidoreductase